MANLNRMSMVYTPGTKLNPIDDVRTYSIAFRCHQPGAPDINDDWNDSRREKMEDDFLTNVQTVLTPLMPAWLRLTSIRWHEIGERREEGYPLERVRELDIVGTGGQGIAPQVASTVTLMTAARKHWGRVYLPISPTVIGNGGRVLESSVDAYANAFKTWFNSMFNLSGWTSAPFGAIPVIVQRTSLSDGLPGVLTRRVIGVRVDDVPDVIRSRRWKSAGYRKIHELADV
jgi:hypothetical protein